jgi:hypothetical protein
MRTTIEMAREAGLHIATDVNWMPIISLEHAERFAELVRKDYSTTHANLWLDRIHKFMLEEREACAKVCDDLPLPPDVARSDASIWEVATLDCAEAIRARSNT